MKSGDWMIHHLVFDFDSCFFFFFHLLDYFIFMSAEDFFLANADCEWHESKSNEKPSEYKLNMKLLVVFMCLHHSPCLILPSVHVLPFLLPCYFATFILFFSFLFVFFFCMQTKKKLQFEFITSFQHRNHFISGCEKLKQNEAKQESSFVIKK